MSTTMTEAVTVAPPASQVVRPMPSGVQISNGEEIPKYTASGEIIKDADHYKELKARNLLYTDYTLLKRVTAEQGVGSSVGFAAVLLQIAHPGVGQGVGNHSDFDKRLLERTRQTAMYVMSTIYGTPEERQAIRKFVTRKHGKVHDHPDKSKRTYDALNPRLQLWVAATGFGTAMIARDIAGTQLPMEEQEQVLQEFSTVGTGLQVPLAMWPRSVADFWVYWNNVIQNELVMTPPAADVTDKLMNPGSNPYIPWGLRTFSGLASPVRKAAAAEILERCDPRIREMFGLPLGWKEWAINQSTGWAQWALTPVTSPLHLSDRVAEYYMEMLRREMKERKIF